MMSKTAFPISTIPSSINCRASTSVSSNCWRNGIRRGTAYNLPPFFRIGSWIGGDRDGNPFVTAPILREAMRLQSSAALKHYLEEIHELGGELPLSLLLVKVAPELGALAARSPDASPHRLDEPYRRALTGIYSRLAATLRLLDQQEVMRTAIDRGDAL